jgi:hypothetical protein
MGKSDGSVILQQWAKYTLAGSSTGAAVGAALAFLRGQPILFMTSAYGLNSGLFCGTFFGIRSVLRDAISSEDTNFIPFCSGAAAAITGGAFTAAVSGARRAPPALLLWGAVGFGGELAVESVNSWRRARALDILSKSDGVHVNRSSPAAPPVASGDISSIPVEQEYLIKYQRPWAWVPFRFGDDHTVRLVALRRRLREINEDLGEDRTWAERALPPPSDQSDYSDQNNTEPRLDRNEP